MRFIASTDLAAIWDASSTISLMGAIFLSLSAKGVTSLVFADLVRRGERDAPRLMGVLLSFSFKGSWVAPVVTVVVAGLTVDAVREEEVLLETATAPGRGKALLPLVGIARREAGFTGTPVVFVFLAESTKFSLSAKASFIFLFEGVLDISSTAEYTHPHTHTQYIYNNQVGWRVMTKTTHCRITIGVPGTVD
jgi:hypothetical protein